MQEEISAADSSNNLKTTPPNLQCYIDEVWEGGVDEAGPFRWLGEGVQHDTLLAPLVW